ncbi:Fic family protein [Kibdelosporangium philippinense]|uniref:Fic family protein n=1 Tax=Kibdelosporangium philippinense TaxID=211113 RepID=A0ABS8ZJ62_9PSEU|nr:Fic family protein [Kibdelosporangium philippinense]MCE7007806.1 Fic family protein [Kibdelosporangium philippinense]
MLFAVPDLDAKDQQVLGEIERFREELRHQVAEPRRWEGQLRRSLVAGAIQGSNSIEGIVVTIQDAQALVDGEEMSASVDDADRAAVTGYCEALTWVQQSAHMNGFVFHEMLLSALHFMMLKHDLSAWPGRYRPGAIYVSGGDPLNPVYAGPQPEQIAQLMAELMDWLNTGDLDAPVLVRAAIAHLNLVSIHPWRDGNGRMSRCLHRLVLARDKVLAPEFASIEEWLGEATNTYAYYEALRQTRTSWQPERNTHTWVRFCLRAHHMQAQLVQRRLERAAKTWHELAEIVSATGLDERVVSALYAAALGQVRRTTYQHDENLTRDQAVRDLQTLRRLGLIEPLGHGKTQRYTAAGAARQRAQEIVRQLGRTPLRDPYSD